MNGLSNLVYHVTQHAALLQKIISDPSLLKTYTSLKQEEIDAFIEVISDKAAMEKLQNLSSQNTKSVSWSRPWLRA